MDRVHVVGSSCSGKTTFAKSLAAALGVKHIELDSLHWEPNWKEAETEVFKDRVREAVSADRWVTDGDYSRKIGDLVSTRATTVIWLDPPLMKILARFFERSLRRSITKELLWNGCRENLRNSIFSKNSLLIWILQNYKRKRERLSRLLADPPKGTNVIRLSSARDVKEFLARDHS